MSIFCIGWVGFRKIGVVIDPWPIWWVHKIFYILFGIIFLGIIKLVTIQVTKEKISDALYKVSDFYKSLQEMKGVEESQKMVGYFDKGFENWKEEYAADKTQLDLDNEDIQAEHIKTEIKLEKEKQLVIQ